MPLGTLNGSDSVSRFKTAMYRKLKALGTSDFDRWERSVFEEVSGRPREDVDWEDEANRQGYKLWVQSFHLLADELLREGNVRIESAGADGKMILSSVDHTQAARQAPLGMILN